MTMDKNFLVDIAHFFEKELDTFIANLKLIHGESLWLTKGEIPNSAGVLAQHIVGNLNHYIGLALGNIEYKREREKEFQISDKTLEELLEELESTKKMVVDFLKNEDPENVVFNKSLPEPRYTEMSMYLINVLQHLCYHTGQLNYLRRVLV